MPLHLSCTKLSLISICLRAARVARQPRSRKFEKKKLKNEIKPQIKIYKFFHICHLALYYSSGNDDDDGDLTQLHLLLLFIFLFFYSLLRFSLRFFVYFLSRFSYFFLELFLFFFYFSYDFFVSFLSFILFFLSFFSICSCTL